MNPILTNCPVCASELTATRLQCQTCNTAIEGQFALGRLGRLSRDQLHFVELMAQNRGNINQVAGALGVSYSTARTRMDEIAAALGATVEPARPVNRGEILRLLEDGDIDADEALRRLQGGPR
jgi:hypothetical protein